MLKLNRIVFTMPLIIAACTTNGVTSVTGAPQTFNIAANTIACQGVAPQRCLIVNNEFFYEKIDGYEHIEGNAAKICVIATKRPEPLPADVSSHKYRRVPCA